MDNCKTKILFITLLLNIIFLGEMHSQDILVTKVGDTIRCKITEMDSTHLSYQINDNNNIERHKIPLSYLTSFFQESSLYSSTDKFVTKKTSYFSISGSFGYAKALGKIEKSGDVYLDRSTRKLTNGVGYELELNHYFRNDIGIGVFLNGFFSSVNDGFNERWNRISLGPSFVVTSKIPDSKMVLDGLLGLGPIFYTAKANYSDKFTYDKMFVTSVALNFGLGGAYMFDSRFAIGIKLTLIASSYSKFQLNGTYYTLDEPYNLSHLNFAVYFRY